MWGTRITKSARVRKWLGGLQALPLAGLLFGCAGTPPATPAGLSPSPVLSAPQDTPIPSSVPRPRRFTQGEVLYLRHCADCHGWEGRGDGPLASILVGKPTNLRRQPALFTQSGDAGLIARILYGQLLELPLDPHAPPYTESEVSALLGYLRSFPRRPWAEISRGREVYDSLCAACHGLYGRGDGLAARSLPAPPPDLIASAEQRRVSDDDLVRLISDGKGAMPGAADVLTPHEVRALIPFLRTLSPGLELYNRFCAYCHGPEGRPPSPAEGPLGPAGRQSPLPVFDQAYFQSHTGEQIRAGIQHMRRRSRPTMPHLAGQLSADEVGDIVSYLRGLPAER
jgi:mono/diheme cytochrome c family protein